MNEYSIEGTVPLTAAGVEKIKVLALL